MRICLLSEYAGIVDEGMRNIAFYLERGLSQRHPVLHLCILPSRRLLSPRLWVRLRAFQPQVIHYIPGPSLKGLVFLRFLKLLNPGARTVVTASHPFFSPLSRRFIPYFKPDLVLTPYPQGEGLFARAGCLTRFLPIGIDPGRFTPASAQEKTALRSKYGLGEDKFIVLHAGAVDRDRNVLLLRRLQQEDGVQVLIVGAVSLPLEREVYHQLTQAHCLVWRRYFPQVEEMFRLADCYVFPTSHWRKGVEVPLSVLEAMSCNLPVISTPYKALPQLFAPGDGLLFAQQEEEFVAALRRVRGNNAKPKTRDMVLPYAWDGVVQKLEGEYELLMKEP